MRIGGIFHAGCPQAVSGDSLREAASRMRARGLSVIPVMSGASLVGILTERDLVEACAKGVRPSMARVADYMNDGPVSVGVDDDSAVAGMKMLAIGCRHLPVTDHGRLVGVVSARDVFLATASGVVT
jgi:CBS domain-containing protein